MLKVRAENKKYVIYKHTSPSGKVYIGQTNQVPSIRFRNGCGYKSSKKFYNSILKYGWENFKHEILFEGLNKISADCIETDLIYYYKQLGLSLNIADGGEGRTRVHDTLETRKRMSIAQFKRFQNTPHPSLGKHCSIETRRKMSNAKTGTTHSSETIMSIKESMKGKNSTIVEVYTLDGRFIEEFPSIGECATFLNVAWVTVSKHLQGKTKSIHRKYIIHRKYHDKGNKEPTGKDSE